MPRFLSAFFIFILVSAFFLGIRANTNPVLAAPRCDDPNIGPINVTFSPSPIPEGQDRIRLFFNPVPDGWYQFRTRKIAGDTFSVEPAQASGGTVELVIDNSDGKLNKGTHVGTLERSTSKSGPWTSLINNSDFCGDISYTVGGDYSSCKLAYQPITPTESDSIIVSVRNAPAGNYPILLGNETVSIIVIDSNGVGTQTLKPNKLFTGRIRLGAIAQNESNPLIDPKVLLNPGIIPANLLSQFKFFCERDITIKTSGGAAPSGACLVIPPTAAYGETKFKASNLKEGNNYHVDVDGILKDQGVAKGGIGTVFPAGTLDLNLGVIAPGNHTAFLYDDDNNSALVCQQPVNVDTNGNVIVQDAGAAGGGHKCTPGDPKCSSAGGETCNPGDGSIGRGDGISTAIGCVPTEPRALVAAVLRVVSFAAGGIALLIMIFGAFRMITATGNPEAIKAGRDQFNAAIFGLLFILFSVLLLQVIGVDILNIPGFSP